MIGYDPRQPISLNVLQHSLYTRSSKPLAITPLVIEQLPLKRTGLTPFTFTRFLVPYLCNYEGWALFMDLDMIALDDISKIFDMADDQYGVMVVKNAKQFEWASLMLFNCRRCKILTPDYIETSSFLHTIGWMPPELIGDLPREFNHLIGYSPPMEKPSVIHYTQGIPAFEETKDCEHANKWFNIHKEMNSATSWVDLMGNSVHAFKTPEGKLLPKYKMEAVSA